MRNLGNQRGSLLLLAVFMIVGVAVLSITFTRLMVGDLSSGTDHALSGQALFVAESGTERAMRGLATGTACGPALIYTNVAVGAGSFTTAGTLNNPVATTLALGGISAAAITIPTTTANLAAAGYAGHGRITIGGEQINYTGLAGNSFTGARRGAGGTTPAVHAAGAVVTQNQCLIRSTGTVAGAQRVVERAVSTGGGNGALMVYAKLNGNGIPYFRLWNGTAWGAEQQANAVAANIHFMVLKSSRTRNEVLLGTQSSTGAINVQVWNGGTWSAPVLIGTTTTAGNLQNYRGFDIEYETLGDRALVVYNNGTRNPQFRIWNGTAWTAPAGLNTALGVANYPSQNAGTRPRWIELAPNPLAASNEIALMTLDSQNDVYGARWTGVGWNNMGTNVMWDTTAATSARKAIDVAYEQNSGRAMFIYGDATALNQRFRIWNGAVLTEPPTSPLVIALMGDGTPGVAQWVRLVPQPQSNNLMYGVVDQRADLNTRFWNGAAWDTVATHPEHDVTVEDINDRNFDIVFETLPANLGRAWLVWGEGGFVGRRQWNGAGWGAQANTGDDTALVQLFAHPVSGDVLAAIYEDTGSATDDIREMHLTGGSAVWSALTQIWAGATIANPVRERVAIGASPAGLTPFDWIEVFQ